MTAVIISMHFLKSFSKLVNFCAATLIFKMEENTQIFGLLCFIISRKVKMQLKCKKRFVQCTEKVLGLMNVPEVAGGVACWRVFAG